MLSGPDTRSCKMRCAFGRWHDPHLRMRLATPRLQNVNKHYICERPAGGPADAGTTTPPPPPPPVTPPPPAVVPAPTPGPSQDPQSSGGGSTTTQDALLPAVPVVHGPLGNDSSSSSNDTSSYDEAEQEDTTAGSDEETGDESPQAAAINGAEPVASSGSGQLVLSSTQPSLLTGTAPVQAPKEAASNVNAAGGRGAQPAVALLLGLLLMLVTMS